ncbi:MAG: bifunctional DNA-binding transcriptional regulator/O6-methylguanine-DNA methyltransferase Ada [Chloroflexales bacterium]|nr:bifunctional DNA-binding transcriptional regulator/O6-methylguanine-DNA methyltransferase Ada [Chloroflexales bacterium]
MAVYCRSGDTPMSYTTDETRWQAVSARDRAADGAFVYGVVTTGVYCRPGCASRAPRRANVRFFATPDEAERAGLRPCKRCAPRAARADGAEAAAVARAGALIEAADEPPTLRELAAAAGLSPFHFHRLFKGAMGVTPAAYARARRAERLRGELPAATSVSAASYEAGFGSSGRLYAESAATLGMTPATYRAGAPGEHISYTVAPSSLGYILVAATARGLCTIELGDDPEALAMAVRARFPQAQLVADAPDLATSVSAVVAMVEAPRRGLDLPLDMQGTAFQRRVWAALRAIPPGATASYAQVAERIGQPGAARAVAQACAANTLAVAIPCHRVVRGDGDPGGYRWGSQRKRELLRREAVPEAP